MPRRGFRVRAFDPRTIEDLYRLRGLLERYAVECLAGRDLSALVASLDESNSRMQAHFTARHIDAYLAENVAFHTLWSAFGRGGGCRVFHLIRTP